MKYPDINIQIRYPNKLINADTPCDYEMARSRHTGETLTVENMIDDIKLRRITCFCFNQQPINPHIISLRCARLHVIKKNS